MSPSGTQKRCWLVKSEPDVFSFDDLVKAKKRTTHWDGIRNFTARNFLRDEMKVGDTVLFYHSNAKPQSIVGVCEVAREGYPDPSAFEKGHHGFDEKSDPAMPQWYMVDIRAIARLDPPVTLPQIKAEKRLADMTLVRIGRLSVSPVTAEEWKVIRGMTTVVPLD